ncbi:MAG: hypothetical protein DRG76_10915 [Deltaproteobacteria bacterium]|nr:MAG: hypothetical protein DRG76_10915 [Deltaproteobacteria bacterium]
MLGLGGEVVGSRRLIFYVDTVPPELEVVEPQGEEIAPAERAFVVRLSDKGSGIPAVVQEMKVDARVHGRRCDVKMAYRANYGSSAFVPRTDWTVWQIAIGPVYGVDFRDH